MVKGRGREQKNGEKERGAMVTNKRREGERKRERKTKKERRRGCACACLCLCERERTRERERERGGERSAWERAIQREGIERNKTEQER